MNGQVLIDSKHHDFLAGAIGLAKDHPAIDEHIAGNTPDHDGQYYTEAEIDTQSLDYSLVSGVRPFTGVVGGIAPIASAHLATKEYVDTAVAGLELDMFLDDLDSTINDPDTANDYYSLQTTNTGDATTTRDAYAALGQGDDQEVVSYISGVALPFAELQIGVVGFHVHARKNNTGQKIATIFGKLYHRASGGTETLIATTEESGNLTSVVTAYDLHGNIASVVGFSATDRLVLKIRANVESAGGSNAQIEITQEGSEDSRVSALVVTDTLSDIFLRQDGTKPLTNNWAVGSFDITGIGALGCGAITSSGASTFNSGSVDADFTVNWNTGTGLFVEGSSGNVGIGTITIPHGGVGWAKFAIDGANASVAGPHVQFTTTLDNYPLMQILNYRHDDISIRFDSYWDGANKSSDAGSNYAIFKVSDLFKIMYDSGVAKGAVLTWNDGIVLNTSGSVTIPNGGLHVGGDSDPGDNNLLVDGTIGSGAITAQGQIIVDVDNTEALSIRDNGGSNKILVVDTTNRRLGVNIVPTATFGVYFNSVAGEGQCFQTADGGAGQATGKLDFSTGDGGASITVGVAGGATGGINVLGGAGGSSTGAGAGVNVGGAGGNFIMKAGSGGAASGGAVNVGGAAGIVSISAGNGGGGSTAGAAGGDATIASGLGAGAAADGKVTLKVGSTNILVCLGDKSGVDITGNLTIDSTFTDGTLSIASGSITSAVNGTFSNTVRANTDFNANGTNGQTASLVMSKVTTMNFKQGLYIGGK